MHRMDQFDLTPSNSQIGKDFAIISPLILTQSVLLMNHQTVQSHTDCFFVINVIVYISITK